MSVFDVMTGFNNAGLSALAFPVDTAQSVANLLRAGIGYAGHKAGLFDAETLPALLERTPGSSQWMRDKGLMKDPKSKGAGLLGEALGAIVPGVAQAKAPQIAHGLLKAADNLAAPTTLSPQAGAIVWHGSPHRFDKFDSSKIGTGEGAQAYGHGLYLAESPEVAKTYKTGGGALQTTMQSDNVMIDGQTWARTLPRSSVESQAATVYANDLFGKTIPEKVSKLRAANMEPVADWLEKNAGRLSLDQGSLYKVDLPDEAIARMLDWDKPLSQQAPGVQRVFASDILDADSKKLMARGGDIKGSKLYELLASTDALAGKGPMGMAASQHLGQQGIPGIRYLDGGSRGTGSGTSNFVVFPGEEHMLKILERK